MSRKKIIVYIHIILIIFIRLISSNIRPKLSQKVLVQIFFVASNLRRCFLVHSFVPKHESQKYLKYVICDVLGMESMVSKLLFSCRVIPLY